MEQSTQSSENNNQVENGVIFRKPKKKSSKKIVLLIGAIIIILGVVLYFSFFSNRENNNTPVLENEKVEEVKIDKELDSDQDGLPDYIEEVLGTYVNNSDTDGDGYSDFEEVKNGYDPLGDGKYTEEEWEGVKGEIRNEDENLYINLFIDKTINWKTYRNEKYGFEIKYPKEWIIKDEVKQNMDSIKEKYRLDIFHPENITEVDIYGNIAVEFFINENNDKFFDQQLDLMRRDTTLTIEEITINGVKGFKGIAYQEVNKAKSMYISQLFLDKEERGIFKILVWTIDLGEETYQEQANLTLSTFRFLE